MYLLNSMLILQVLSVSLSKNVELEGVLKLDSNFSKILAIDSTIDQPLDMRQPTVSRSKSKLPKKNSPTPNNTISFEFINRTNDLIEYVDHIKKKGTGLIKFVGKQIIKGIKLKKNFTQNINTASVDYIMTMQKYLEFIAGQRKEFATHEELIFLDIVETACRLLYREQRKLLIDTVAAVNDANNKSDAGEIHLQNINRLIYKQNIRTKKEEMQFICHKYRICRPYPAFTDYFADFIADLLRIPEKKFDTFVKLFKIIVQINDDFFKLIANKEDRILILKQVSILSNDNAKTQEALSVLRAVLTQRFKIIHNPHPKLKMRSQAVRILLNIIDKAFQYEHEDLVIMEFSTVVKAIRAWVNNERPFPEYVITQFFINIIKILVYNLSKHAKNEVNVLIETMLRGSSKNEELYNSLFLNGSKYVKGDDYHPDVSIIL